MPFRMKFHIVIFSLFVGIENYFYIRNTLWSVVTTNNRSKTVFYNKKSLGIDSDAKNPSDSGVDNTRWLPDDYRNTPIHSIAGFVTHFIKYFLVNIPICFLFMFFTIIITRKLNIYFTQCVYYS